MPKMKQKHPKNFKYVNAEVIQAENDGAQRVYCCLKKQFLCVVKFFLKR